MQIYSERRHGAFWVEPILPFNKSYEQFEMLMDKALKEPIPIDQYQQYMKRHYTSVRAQQLKDILAKYE